jgi:hypothetical protein
MRAPIIMLLAITASLLGETQAGNAQSPYSYPWCAIPSGGDDSGGGAMSCYYTSRQQRMTTLSGIGGSCVGSPYYHTQPTPLPNPSSVKPRPPPARLIIGSLSSAPPLALFLPRQKEKDERKTSDHPIGWPSDLMRQFLVSERARVGRLYGVGAEMRTTHPHCF